MQTERQQVPFGESLWSLQPPCRQLTRYVVAQFLRVSAHVYTIIGCREMDAVMLRVTAFFQSVQRQDTKRRVAYLERGFQNMDRVSGKGS